MIYVLMQAPNNGYYFVVQATSDKHFAMLDKDFVEIDNGFWMEMVDKMRILESHEEYDLIFLYCDDTKSLIQVDEEGLNKILETQPDYLNNKDFL